MSTTAVRGRVVVITGASSGFGKGTALELARRGASLALAARRGELLDELAHECEAGGGRAIAIATDVSRAGDVAQLAERTLTALGPFDVWINNAGVGALGPFGRVPLADHAQVIETNLLGTLYGSYQAYRQFTNQRHGTLINIASELGQHTVPYYASYAASKHGVVGLTASLRQEVDQGGMDAVHVCLVMPTAHDTPFFDHVANYSGHEIQAPPPLHDPQNVVDTLVGLVENPKDSKIVGADGVAKILLKRLAPGIEERLAGWQLHRMQMEQAPPASDSPGAVHQPIARGRDVSAGRRAS